MLVVSLPAMKSHKLSLRTIPWGVFAMVNVTRRHTQFTLHPQYLVKSAVFLCTVSTAVPLMLPM